ncbi:MAG: type II toxin-antitoxin system prevent-host-death family antitoxin [Scrofimicrobium sp.]
MAIYSVLEAKNNFSRVVSQAVSGDTVVITKRGTPVAKLLPIPSDPKPFTGSALAAWIKQTSPARSSLSTEEIDQRIAVAQGDWD